MLPEEAGGKQGLCVTNVPHMISCDVRAVCCTASDVQGWGSMAQNDMDKMT